MRKQTGWNYYVDTYLFNDDEPIHDYELSGIRIPTCKRESTIPIDLDIEILEEE